MRPDSQLYIVPAEGGVARRMRCNTPLMNSWHSFSPDGRWLVFSSKSRSPYTQMYLTHIDEDGNDSPAILVENATAANRAVNLPEFVNVPPGGLLKLGGPALDYYKLFNDALFLQKKGRLAESAAEWRRTIEANPEDPLARDNFGMVLLLAGRREEAAEQIEKARELRLRSAVEAAPEQPEPHVQLGELLRQEGRLDDALAQFRKAVEIEPGNAVAHSGLGGVLAAQGKLDKARNEYVRALALNGHYAPALCGLGTVQELRGEKEAAIASWREALAADPKYAEAHLRLAHTLSARGEKAEALAHWREGLQGQPSDMQALLEAAWLMATSADASLRNGREALSLAVRALQLNAERKSRAKEKSFDMAESAASEAAILDTLAAAYAECGRFADAVLTARRALTLANSAQAEDIKRRVASYQRQMPFREMRAAAQ